MEFSYYLKKYNYILIVLQFSAILNLLLFSGEELLGL